MIPCLEYIHEDIARDETKSMVESIGNALIEINTSIIEYDESSHHDNSQLMSVCFSAVKLLQKLVPIVQRKIISRRGSISKVFENVQEPN